MWRPCFHDTYLQTSNQPHVTLVPTEPHGLHCATPAGLVVRGREYPLDVLAEAEKKANAQAKGQESSHSSSGSAVIEPTQVSQETYVHHLLSLAAFHAPIIVVSHWS